MGKKIRQYKNDLENEYEAVIKIVETEMDMHRNDWEGRYKEYLEVLCPGSRSYQRIVRLKDCFRIEKPITRYLSITYAKRALNNVVYDLRVYGHSIGNLTIKTNKGIAGILDADSFASNDKKRLVELIRDNGVAKVAINKTNRRAICLIANDVIPEGADRKRIKKWINDNLGIEEDYKTKKFGWNSKEMSQLRSCLQSAEKDMLVTSEHSCENLLLNELSNSDGRTKYLKNIQPVTIGKSGFFQMPTCLKASGAKGSIDKIDYSDQKGGGIDILARIKRGNKAELCVIELKDEYKQTERPVLAMRQAIAYAVCLDHVIRSPKVNENKNWYDDVFMPESKVDLPDSININVVVAMPFPEGVGSEAELSEEDKCFAGKELTVNAFEHQDKLVMHYIFFKTGALKETGTTNGIISSLPLKQNF